MKIKIAESVFLVKNEDNKLLDYFKDFITFENENCILDFNEYKGEFMEKVLSLFQDIILWLLNNSNVLRIHSSAIKAGENVYSFLAPSGTGKSTHARLWEKYCPLATKVINDDQPFYLFKENKVFAYSSPLSGKNNKYVNDFGVVKAFVILRQAKFNGIKKLDKKHAFTYLYKQVFIPKSVKESEITLELIEKAINTVPVYLLDCDISKQAYDVCFNELKDL